MPEPITLGLAAAAGLLALSKSGGLPDPVWTQWDPLLRKYTGRFGVPWRWSKSILIIESSLGQADSVQAGLENPLDTEASASTDRKSWGLWQMTPSTAEWMMGRQVAPFELNDPEINAEAAHRYMKYLLVKFDSDREGFARGYNGGPGYASTVQGQRDTPAYYAHFQVALAEVQRRNPGDEMED